MRRDEHSMRPSRLSGMLIIIFLIWLVALLLLGCAERRLTVMTPLTRAEIPEAGLLLGEWESSITVGADGKISVKDTKTKNAINNLGMGAIGAVMGFLTATR